MKIYGSLLALSVFHPNVWGTDAFVVQAPKTPFTSLEAMNNRMSDIFSTPAPPISPPRQMSAPSAPAPMPTTRQGAIEQGRYKTGPSTQRGGADAKKLWEKSTPVAVQGGSLKTWSFASPYVERVQVMLKTEGRPLDADVDLWQGPDNTPQKMRVYVEDGSLRPFCAVLETPRAPNTIAIRNTAMMEFPLAACVVADAGKNGPEDTLAKPLEMKTTGIVQGGALKTFPFDPTVNSVQVVLKTDGRPLNARIELLQGPNNNKQVMEIYTEDGLSRPFYAVLETPGSGNVVRIVNTATMEFPLTASVEALKIGSDVSATEPVMGGDPDAFMMSGW